jgi:hypothetical protein
MYAVVHQSVQVEPLDTLGFSQYDTTHPARSVLFAPLQQKVRDQGLWACHLGPELGGPGMGQFKVLLQYTHYLLSITVLTPCSWR